MPQRRNRETCHAGWLRLAGFLALLILAFQALKPLRAYSSESTGTPASTDPAASMDPPRSTDSILLLEVIVNGHSTGQIGEFILRDGLLYVRPKELQDLGFRVPDRRMIGADGLIALNDLPGFIWKIDAAKQQLLITATDDILTPTVLQSDQMHEREHPPQIESGTGLTLNYDTVGTFASGQEGGSGSFDFRSFTPWGIISSDWLTYAGSQLNGSVSGPVVRLDSAYTFGDVKSLRRYSVGDFINGGLSWTRPLHMEGLQIRSDFTMRPDLITFPVPSIGGSTTVPSTVDVLVNGNVVSSSQVNPGPFQVQQLPIISGAGTITMTMTNAQGGQVTVTQPFYGGSLLLAKGLQTFAGQAGLVRRNWGVASNDYGKLASTMYYRRGLSQSFTAEATAEATPGAYMAGAGGAATLWNRAMLNLDVAASDGSGGVGELISAGVQHIGTVFSMGGSAILASRNYRDVASMNGVPNQRKQISAFGGLTLRHLGSLGLAYAAISQDPSPVQVPDAPTIPLQERIVTANYSVQAHHVAFYANEFRNLDEPGSSGMQIGFTIPLSRRSSMSVSGTSDGSAQVQVQKSPVTIGDWGYQAYVSAGGPAHEFGTVQYKSPVGLFTAGADNTAGQTTLRLESQGAISLLDRDLFPSNTIFDSFAIVDTAPLEHVHVYEENRDVGTTGKSGRLLVPDMRSFEANHLGIDAKDVPADATLVTDTSVIRPQDRSGVVVRFHIRFSHSALLKLVDEADLPIPLGSNVILLATRAIAPVGYDGETYLEDLSPHNQLSVELKDGRHCTAKFEYKPVPGDLPTVGPIRCVGQKP